MNRADKIAGILRKRADNIDRRIKDPYFILYLFGKLLELLALSHLTF